MIKNYFKDCKTAEMVYKEHIKSAGFWWSKSKKAWYYNGDKKKSHRRGRYNMDKLREKWGTTEIDPDPRPRLVCSEK